MSVDVAVIGGGVSGLAAAYELSRRGRRVVVLERQVRAGGNAISERLGGFLMEHGPSTVNATSAAAAGLSTALGLDDARRELGPEVRRRYLVAGERLHGLGTRPLAFLASDYLSPLGRLRLAAEALIPRRDDAGEETVAAFCRRRFGAEFSDRVMDPLVGGLYGGTLATLSMAAAFPRLVEMERRHGSIARAVLRARLNGGQMPGRRLFSWRDGVGALPRALAGGLGRAVRTGVAVRAIRPCADGYRIDLGRDGGLDARCVLIATQPHVAASLLDGLDSAGAEAAAAISAPPLAVVFLGYRRDQIDHPLDGLGYLAASGEGRAISGALFASTMFADRAPDGHVALAAYIGGARAPERAMLPIAMLIDLARDDFAELLGARGAPVIARARQWPRGLPQYELGHAARATVLGDIGARRPGLYVTGNYLSGVSVAACIERAGETAGRIDHDLAARARAANAIHVMGRRATSA